MMASRPFFKKLSKQADSSKDSDDTQTGTNVDAIIQKFSGGIQTGTLGLPPKQKSNRHPSPSIFSSGGTSDKLKPLPLSRTQSAPIWTECASPPRPPVHPSTQTVSRSPRGSSTDDAQSSNAAASGGRNMIQPKSRQRIVLEEVAAQFFLDGKERGRRSAVYAGEGDYGSNENGGEEEDSGLVGNNSMLGLDGGETERLRLLLGLDNYEGGERCDGENAEEEDAYRTARDELRATNDVGDDMRFVEKGIVIDLLAAATSTSSIADSNATDNDNNVNSNHNSEKDESKSQLSKTTAKFTDSTIDDNAQSATPPSNSIDQILEQASTHLSLGHNSLALETYRRAMKVAFANVVEVKQKLMKVKRDQIQFQFERNEAEDAGLSDYLENGDIDLTRQQEREFELLLLQVASRVADIHNNMGVVHEMNRHFQKAQSSYRDALDVYHNTCRRFEQTGNPDVDRTHRNVDRMMLACNSERERKELHSRASQIDKQLNLEKTFGGRKTLLNDAVSTLQSALELETRTIGDTHPVAASTLTQMGKYHYELRDFDSSVKEIRRALTILRDALGPNHPQVCKAILLLASVYERQGLNITPRGKSKEDAELELYVDALDPLKAALTETHPEVGFLYIKIGYLYGRKGDRNLSALAYKAALKAYGEPESSISGKVNPEVLSTWVCLTEQLMELKCWEEVLAAGRRSLFLLRRAKNTLYPDAQLSSPPVNASSHSSSKSSKKSPIQISPYTYFGAVFTTLQCLGQAHTSLSQYPFAKTACEESLQLAWEMALANNVNSLDPLKPPDLSASILKVIRALKRLGKVHLLQKHYSDSLQCFLPALQLLRSSQEMESSVDAASVMGSLGFLYLKMEKFFEARNFLKECLRLFQHNGVDHNDRETRKIQAWLAMAEAKEVESASAPPSYLEIPTIVFNEVGQYEL